MSPPAVIGGCTWGRGFITLVGVGTDTASLDNACLQCSKTRNTQCRNISKFKHLQLLPELGLAGTDVCSRPPVIQRPQHLHLVQ
jgi:hypothetical protein